MTNKPQLSIQLLIQEAKQFCEDISNHSHPILHGVTDGKAVGTYVEHAFKNKLENKYDILIGNSASGIDLPSELIKTDIKVTSIMQPQSSCPFKTAKQKVFGLGYNLLLFVYEKDDSKEFNLPIKSCAFIDKDRTADYSLTRHIIHIIQDGGNKEDIIGYLQDRNLPADDIVLNEIADQCLKGDIKQGYLTISNALQWRLQYQRIVNIVGNEVEGIVKIL